MKLNQLCVAIGTTLALMAPTCAAAAAIHEAARRGDIVAVMHMLDAGVALDDRDDTRETPLLAAALGGHSRLVVDLLIRGADPKARNDRGMTVLHAAAFAGDLQSVKWLISAGADLEAADNKFGVTPLIVAAEEDRIEVVSYLIGLGANLETIERHGYTALTRAGYHGNDRIIATLLTAGAVCQEIDPLWLKDCATRETALGL
jgi:ankyrin repeat protein